MPTKDNNNQYVTKKDLTNELKKFATKEDLKNELKKFATKDDLKKFATKDDLKKFATKDDFDLLAGEIVNLNHRIDNVETNLSTRIQRHENQLGDHEKRIKTLEEERN